MKYTMMPPCRKAKVSLMTHDGWIDSIYQFQPEIYRDVASIRRDMQSDQITVIPRNNGANGNSGWKVDDANDNE